MWYEICKIRSLVHGYVTYQKYSNNLINEIITAEIPKTFRWCSVACVSSRHHFKGWNTIRRLIWRLSSTNRFEQVVEEAMIFQTILENFDILKSKHRNRAYMKTQEEYFSCHATFRRNLE